MLSIANETRYDKTCRIL